jgi:hypothetical protein
LAVVWYRSEGQSAWNLWKYLGHWIADTITSAAGIVPPHLVAVLVCCWVAPDVRDVAIAAW